MSYVPDDVEWFLAEIIMEITVEGDDRNVVHNNWTLVRANSADDAFKRAIELGEAQANEHVNPEGKTVRFAFRGLKDLHVIYDELEHGSEVLFEETVSVEETQLQRLLKPKDRLSAFIPHAPGRRKGVPDYGAKGVVEKLEQMGFPRPPVREGK